MILQEKQEKNRSSKNFMAQQNALEMQPLIV